MIAAMHLLVHSQEGFIDARLRPMLGGACHPPARRQPGGKVAERA